MESKKDDNYNQLAFFFEILRLLSEKPRKRKNLVLLLSDFLHRHSRSSKDISQKISRAINKLRQCGFEIRCAPNRPYELVASSFPVILTDSQRQSLSMAAYILTDMGFSAQASDLLRIGKLGQATQTGPSKVNFSPPVAYGEERLDEIIEILQQRFRQRRRYTIRYRSSSGKEQNWDLDRSELRFHNGILYLFAFAPDFSPHNQMARPNVEQNRLFRCDRILTVRAASEIPWGMPHFPSLKICYRMSGPLGVYQPRRINEWEISRDPDKQWVEIETQEDCLFWFRQRILQYGENVRVLHPPWLVRYFANTLQRAYKNYCEAIISTY